jgi:ribonucleoside-diphosphate reductase alpha chain
MKRKLRPSEEQELSDAVAKKVTPKKTDVPVTQSAAKQKAEADEAESDYDRAKQLGYTGDSCPECGSMTMIRNGTCQKCITCGSTTGCS